MNWSVTSSRPRDVYRSMFRGLEQHQGVPADLARGVLGVAHGPGCHGLELFGLSSSPRRSAVINA